MKVSESPPSTQVLSSSEPPPAAVPTQFTAGPPGLTVPELGCAECRRAVKNPNTIRKIPVTKKSAPIVARAVIEGEEIFFIGRTFVKSALRFGKISDRGRLSEHDFCAEATAVEAPFGREPSISSVWSPGHRFHQRRSR